MWKRPEQRCFGRFWFLEGRLPENSLLAGSDGQIRFADGPEFEDALAHEVEFFRAATAASCAARGPGR